jgi:restriction system protein
VCPTSLLELEEAVAVPDFLTRNREEHAIAKLRKYLEFRLKLTGDELAQRLASDSQTVFASRVAWAVQYLKQAGLLETVRRGVYKITDRGSKLLDDNPTEITTKTLRRYPEFLEFLGKSAPSEDVPTSTDFVETLETKDTPEESLENSYQTLRDALAPSSCRRSLIGIFLISSSLMMCGLALDSFRPCVL